MIIEEIFPIIIGAVFITVMMVVGYIFSRIPGAKYILKLFVAILYVVRFLFYFAIRFIMFFMAGYFAFIILSFTDKAPLYNGEVLSVFFGDNSEATLKLLALYTIFSLVALYVIIYSYAFIKVIFKIGNVFFDEEIIHLLLIGTVIYIFPSLVHALMPEFEISDGQHMFLQLYLLCYTCRGVLTKRNEGHVTIAINLQRIDFIWR
ncbi:hypothetical protein [Paracerasibacillus soli]|uniref:Colicin V production protein n=1 Tax=Paracerasibacillus soli TaxID=480284 RepID=A0ABU5CUQ7_9BACI|nr:hypothetical protein [Virgibacillus soli]MDY0410107.1 hypothetical protein [Virgibacillus soli]